jgi:hypothetical protein
VSTLVEGSARIPCNYVSGAELGVRNPTFDVVTRWLSALGVSWTEFGSALEHASSSSRTLRG